MNQIVHWPNVEYLKPEIRVHEAQSLLYLWW